MTITRPEADAVHSRLHGIRRWHPIANAPEGGVLSEEQNREIAQLAACADEYIVQVYSGKVDMI